MLMQLGYVLDEPEAPPEKPSNPTSREKPQTESRLDYLTKLSRGEISGSSSSDDSSSDSGASKEDSEELSEADGSDEDSSSESSDSDSYVGVEGGPLAIPGESDIPVMEDSTRRLAIQNCDWNSISAEDLMYVLFSLMRDKCVKFSAMIGQGDLAILLQSWYDCGKRNCISIRFRTGEDGRRSSSRPSA
jgi:hypothetical protein